MKRLALTYTLLCCFIAGFPQNTEEFEIFKQKYGRYNAVITEISYAYTFDVSEDTLLVSQINTQELLMLKEHAKMFTNDYIFHSSFTSINGIEAYSLIPEGKKFRKVDVEHFNESHDLDGSVFYDDSKTIQFSYPSVQQRVKTHLSYNINYLNPRFIRSSYLQTIIPILKGKITAKVHRDVTIGYELLNDQAEKVKFTQYKKGKYHYHEWEVADMAPYPYYPGGYYSVSHHSPHVAIYVDETNINGQKRNYFGETADLYRYYNGFTKEVPGSTSPELKQIVEDLTLGLSEPEKVKAIFYWVQENVNYIAYEEGYRGLRPSSADEVFKKRFGDCKGMTSIIKEMMRIAGVEGHYSWVGTRDIPYTHTKNCRYQPVTII